MDEKEAIENHRWRVNICLSGKCDRGCHHCLANGSMNGGSFFTLEQAYILAKNVKKFVDTLNDRKIDLRLGFACTGNGEIMLNSQYPQIFDVFFNIASDVEARIVTSGVDSNEEEQRLLEILSRPYAKKLEWYLSFNLFQSGFPKRLVRTLKLFFENGVDKVMIKITQAPQDVYGAIRKLNRIIEGYFAKWIREVRPLIISLDTDFVPVDFSKSTEQMMLDLFDGNLSPNPDISSRNLQATLKNVRSPTRETLGGLFVHLNTNFDRAFRFETRYGEKKIVYAPQHLIKRGRAATLKNVRWRFPDIKTPCRYLRSTEEKTSPIHIGSDGFYYPSCDCPSVEEMRIGHIKDDISSMLSSFYVLHRLLLFCMIKDNQWYDDICDHCIHVMQRLRNQKFLSEIGIA
ncbi:MAG: hypothetical protein WCV59_05180 [Parcubacteria group bacterium]|jgi:hypothetical protein